jgi:hypothetical protein
MVPGSQEVRSDNTPDLASHYKKSFEHHEDLKDQQKDLSVMGIDSSAGYVYLLDLSHVSV